MVLTVTVRAGGGRVAEIKKLSREEAVTSPRRVVLRTITLIRELRGDD